jgi:hypothetical protein
MPVKAKALFNELHTAIKPVMTAHGFVPEKEGHRGWVRETAAGYSMLRFQADKWGWNERWGGRFTLEFQMAASPEMAYTLAGRFERIGYVLEGFEALDLIRLHNNAVIGRLPGTLGGHLVATLLPDGTEFISEGFRVAPQKAVYGHDIWMHYYTLDDVREWARFFAAHLPRFAEMFEHEIRSAEGAARVRFNAMMARVQALPRQEAQAKEALLQDYVRTEADPEFKAAAKHWLKTLRELLGPGHGAARASKATRPHDLSP